MNTTDAARSAIRTAGGPQQLAAALTAMTGAPVTFEQVRKWRQRGVPARWVPAVAAATKIPAADLHPAFRVSSAA